jgi:hypothetical protein
MQQGHSSIKTLFVDENLEIMLNFSQFCTKLISMYLKLKCVIKS